MDLQNYGFIPETDSGDEMGIPARITAVHKERYELVCEYGLGYARLKTKEYYNGTEDFPTAGDFVRIDYVPNGDSRIIRTLPRRTFFSRRDPTPGRGEQAVAANFDYVFILQSLNHNFNGKRLERYLTLAWQSGAVPGHLQLSAQRQLHRQGGYLFYPGRCRVLRGRPEKGGQGLPGQRMVGKGSHTQRGLLRQVQLRQNY